MKSNEELQKDVQDAIKWEPLLHAAEIGVTTKDGVVTLSGTVSNFAKKLEAENAAKSVAGVKAVVEKIDVKYANFGKKDDNEIAVEALSALKSNWEVPADKVKVKVENGWVTLDGELEWNFQKDAARKSVKNVPGITGVVNNIKIRSETNDAIEKRDIENALGRNWSIDDEDIEVKVSGNNVTLNGSVESIYQKDEAERIARNAPGVWTVDNELVVDFEY